MRWTPNFWLPREAVDSGKARAFVEQLQTELAAPAASETEAFSGTTGV